MPGVSTQPGWRAGGVLAALGPLLREHDLHALGARVRGHALVLGLQVLEVVGDELLRVHAAGGDPDRAVGGQPLREHVRAEHVGGERELVALGRSRRARAASRPRCGRPRAAGPPTRPRTRARPSSRLTSSVWTANGRLRVPADRDVHVGALPREPVGDRAPEPRLGAGDQHDLAVQPRQRSPAAPPRVVADVAVAQQRAIEGGVQELRHHQESVDEWSVRPMWCSRQCLGPHALAMRPSGP